MDFSVVYRKPEKHEITGNFLGEFDRTQDVSVVIQGKPGNKKKIAKRYVDDWSTKRRIEVEDALRKNIESNGIVIFASSFSKLVGFVSISTSKKGPENDYNELYLLHVDRRFRNHGIGKRLFEEGKKHAETMGIKKLYISSNSAFETVEFYRSVGCKEAVWIDAEQVRKEPCDYQLEYVIADLT